MNQAPGAGIRGIANGDHFRALDHGRELYARHAWQSAFDHLSRADSISPLDADDLERLAWSAALAGRDREMLQTLERTYRAHLDANGCTKAARAAFWLGYRLLFLGERGRASGWLARAQDLTDRFGNDCAERGYLCLPVVQRQLATGNLPEALAAATSAVECARRFGDWDLDSLGQSLQGRCLIRMGRIEAGLALLDQSMVTATTRQLSPIVTGLVYCAMIACCQRIYALERVREWTTALATWCDAQPELVIFTGSCSVDRAEILQLDGKWAEAIAETSRVLNRLSLGRDPDAVAADAHYQQAEVHRLRGEFAAAEAAYRNASLHGREPQPGLALLRLAQGQGGAADSAIRRVTDATTDPLQRLRFLPAFIEIVLALGDSEAARSAATELETIAERYRTDAIDAFAAHARGAVYLATGDARGAIEPLRAALRVWLALDAPYLAARLRVQLARANSALGDADGALLELDAARATFEKLGATVDLVGMGWPTKTAAPPSAHGLTARELEVLLLVAGGKTNKAIARELDLSDKTIDRHVSNIFKKLDVPSRAAATAYVYEHGLK